MCMYVSSHSPFHQPSSSNTSSCYSINSYTVTISSDIGTLVIVLQGTSVTLSDFNSDHYNITLTGSTDCGTTPPASTGGWLHLMPLENYEHVLCVSLSSGVCCTCKQISECFKWAQWVTMPFILNFWISYILIMYRSPLSAKAPRLYCVVYVARQISLHVLYI